MVMRYPSVIAINVGRRYVNYVMTTGDIHAPLIQTGNGVLDANNGTIFLMTKGAKVGIVKNAGHGPSKWRTLLA
jgi:hypothetical protein